MSDMEEYPFGFMNTPSCLQVLASTEIALALWRYKFKYAASNYSYWSVRSLLKQNFSCQEIDLLVAPPRIKAVINGRIAAVRVELYGFLCPGDPDFQMCFKHMVVDHAGSICGKASAVNIANSDDFSKCSQNRTAREIFVERFSPVVVKDVPDQERTSRVISFLQSGQYKSAIHLLPKLNRFQAEKVFEEEAPEILRILVLNNAYFLNLREFWTDMKHVVLKDESIFCGVLHELWRLVFDPTFDESHWNKYQGDQINDFLLEIWSNAPCKLKTAVSNQCVSNFFSRLSDDTDRLDWYYGHDMTFALDMLKKSQTVNKEQAWRTHWRKFALRAKPSCLEEFMKLCLPNDEAVELFKNNMLNFTDLFQDLIQNALYSRLKNYLIFCTKDAKRLQSVSVELLSTNLYEFWDHGEDEFAKLNRFLVELSSMVKMDVDELKARIIISSTENLEFLRDVALEIDSKKYMRNLNRLITSAQQLQQLKRKCFDICPDYLINGYCAYFSIDKWQWFLEWCTEDREEIVAFKRSLNIDAIFLKRLEDDDLIIEKYERRDILRFLDRFLKWYFGNEEDAKNFKFEKLKAYERIEIFRVEMESNFTRYEVDVTYELFMWFFDNNMEHVREFCKTYDFIPSILR